MSRTVERRRACWPLVDDIAGRTRRGRRRPLADEFIYGEIERVSREAPVLILNYDSTEIVPGGAGNAASNVAALGGAARVVGVAGRDEAGRRLLDALQAAPRRRRQRAAAARGYRTPIKTRILAGGIHSAKQQVVRIDRAARGGDRRRRRARRSRRACCARVRGADALLVSDYGSGLVTPARAGSARARRVAPKTQPPPIARRLALRAARASAA